MKKHKAFGVPTAIALCSLLLIVSMGVGATVLSISAMSKVRRVQSNYEIVYRTSTNQFIDGGASGTVDNISDHTFEWAIYEGENHIRALVAENAKTVRFYAIYDFEHDDLLAYQSSKLFISEDGSGHKLLGGLVIYGGENL